MLPILRLLRLPNLLIVALTQVLLYFTVIFPPLREAPTGAELSFAQFFLLVLVTVLITATGYITNDLLDQETDRINRPERPLSRDQIRVEYAAGIAIGLFVAGLLIASYLAVTTDKLPLLSIYPLACAGLYAYNARLKKYPLLGNLTVALFCAGAAFILWVAEWPALRRAAETQPGPAQRAWLITLWYLVFAFLSTLFREIIKDVEDMEGDRKSGYQTLPLEWGVEWARRIGMATGVLLLLFIGGYAYFNYRAFGWLPSVFLAAGIVLPLGYSLQQLAAPLTKERCRRISLLAKYIMVSGILLLLLLHF